MFTKLPAPKRGFLLALMCAAAVSAAGCLPAEDGSGAAPQAALPDIVVGSTPQATATPSVGVLAKPSYPGNARDYAQAVVKAWNQNHIGSLGELTTAQVQEQLLEIPAPLDDSWVYLRCDGAAGSSYCIFANGDGDELTLRISHPLLGKAHAAIEVKLDVTKYPLDGLAYVKQFVNAWQIGNTSRMLKLSTQSVVDKVGTAPQQPTYPAPDCCGGGLLQIRVNWTGSSARFDVGTVLLGGPHAIVGYDHELLLKAP